MVKYKCLNVHNIKHFTTGTSKWIWVHKQIHQEKIGLAQDDANTNTWTKSMQPSYFQKMCNNKKEWKIRYPMNFPFRQVVISETNK